MLAVTYVLASGEKHARRLADLVLAGRIPPMATSREELVELRLRHPLPLIGQQIPYAVYTGLASPQSKRLDSGDWATEVCRAIEERSHEL